MSDKTISNLRLWFRGLMGAIISGGAHAVTGMAIAPETFNIHQGLSKLIQLSIGGALISGAMFLQKSPLPELEKNEDTDNQSPKP